MLPKNMPLSMEALQYRCIDRNSSTYIGWSESGKLSEHTITWKSWFASWFGWSVKVPESGQKEVQTLLEKLDEYKDRYKHIADLALTVSIKDRKVTLPEVLPQEKDACNASQLRKAVDTLVETSVGKLLDAEAALICRIATGDESYIEGLEKNAIENLIKDLLGSLDSVDITAENKQVFIRQFVGRLREAHESVSPEDKVESARELAEICELLGDEIKLLEVVDHPELMQAEATLMNSVTASKGVEDSPVLAAHFMEVLLKSSLSVAVSREYQQQVVTAITQRLETRGEKAPELLEALEQGEQQSLEGELPEESYRLKPATLQPLLETEGQSDQDMDPTQGLKFGREELTQFREKHSPTEATGLLLDGEEIELEVLKKELPLTLQQTLTTTFLDRHKTKVSGHSSTMASVTASLQPEKSVLWTVIQAHKTNSMMIESDEPEGADDEVDEDSLVQSVVERVRAGGQEPEETLKQLQTDLEKEIGELRAAPETEDQGEDIEEEASIMAASLQASGRPVALAIKDRQLKKMHSDWDKQVKQVFGRPLEQLPPYEQRALGGYFYKLCTDKSIDTKTSSGKMKPFLTPYKTREENLLEQTAVLLNQWKQQGSPGRKMVLSVDAKEGVKGLGISNRMSSDLANDASVVLKKLCCEFVPGVCGSPYDEVQSLEEYQQHLKQLQSDMTDEQSEFNQQLNRLLSASDEAKELGASIKKDSDRIKNKLDEKLGVVEVLIENDYSRTENLNVGAIRLIKSAVRVIKQEMEKAANLPAGTEAEQASQEDRLLALGFQKRIFESEINQYEQAGRIKRLQPNIVENLHALRKKTWNQLIPFFATDDETVEQFDRMLEQELTTLPWQPVLKKYVMQDDEGNYHTYDIENIPMGALRWFPQLSEEAANLAYGGDGKDPFNLKHCGRASMSTSEQEHAVNGWVVRMKDANGQQIMKKFRTGVPVSYPMFSSGASDQKIKEVVLNRLKETIVMMLLEAKGNTHKFRQALAAGEPVSFSALHTSLLSPDMLRAGANKVAKKFGASAHQLAAKKLDNEGRMLKLVEEAITELNKKPLELSFQDAGGNDHAVTVDYHGTLVACPVNGMGQKGIFNVWADSDRINKKAMKELFGHTDPTREPEGIVGEKLSDGSIPFERREFVKETARQIQYIVKHNRHHKSSETAVKLTTLMNTISPYLVDGYHDFCKSGKDRTGYVNKGCIATRAQNHTRQDQYLTPVDRPATAGERFSEQSALATTGQGEIVQQNLAEAGMKIDQGPERTGNLFHRIHFKSEKHIPKISVIS